jgi:hypothetical protein
VQARNEKEEKGWRKLEERTALFWAHHRRRTSSEQKPGPMAARMLKVPGVGRR